MSIRARVCVVAAAAFGVVSSAYAQTVQTNNGGPPDQVTSIANYTSYFSELDGMTLSWTYADGRTGSGVWGALGGGLYGVEETNATNLAHHDDFDLEALGSDDTYGLIDPYVWDLTANNLTGFDIDPMTVAFTPPASPTLSAVFDIVNAPVVGTPGSSYGRPFQYGGCFFLFCGPAADDWNTTATYSDPVGVGGNAPVGDLYGLLDVTFGRGKTLDGSVDFSADVDLVDGAPNAQVTPEPGSLTLLAGGLAGMAAAAKRRRRR